MTSTFDIAAALRSLDAAPDCRITADEAATRARTELRRVAAIDPAPEPVRRPRPVIRRRIVLAAATMTAVAAASVALPAITGGDQAFASWTRVPHGMTEQQRTEAVSECRTAQRGGAGAEYAAQLGSAVAVIAERRGVWNTVVLAGRDGFSALCVTDASAQLFGKGMIGSIGTPSGQATPGPGGVIATDLGTGTVHGKDVSLAAGRTGAGVVAVVYHSPSRGNVAATVSQGHFALWLPGDDLRDAASRGVRVDVRYRDGSTGTARLTL